MFTCQVLIYIQEAEEKIKDIEEKIKTLKNTELSQAKAQAERAQFEITYEEAQELLDVLPEWMLDDEPKIVNGLLTRLFRCIRVMPNGEIIPVLRK